MYIVFVVLLNDTYYESTFGVIWYHDDMLCARLGINNIFPLQIQYYKISFLVECVFLTMWLRSLQSGVVQNIWYVQLKAKFNAVPGGYSK